MVPCLRIGSLHIAKMSSILNMIYRFSIVTIKILARYFVYVNNLILKFIQKGKRYTILKKIKVEWLVLPDFKMYCKNTIISNQASRVLVKNNNNNNKKAHQQGRQSSKATSMEKRQCVQQMVPEKLDVHAGKKKIA